MKKSSSSLSQPEGRERGGQLGAEGGPGEVRKSTTMNGLLLEFGGGAARGRDGAGVFARAEQGG